MSGGFEAEPLDRDDCLLWGGANRVDSRSERGAWADL